MKDVTEQQTWKSKDFYLSCVVRASGTPLSGIEKSDHDFVLFVFNIPPKKAEEIISQHWQGILQLPTKDLIEAINELRTRLKNGM